MATDTFPLIADQRVIACSLEATTGTAESLDGTDAAFNAYLVSDGIEDLSEQTDRQGEGSSSMLASVPGARWGRLQFETDVCGLGTTGVGTHNTALFGACGYNISGGTLTPVTGETQADTITIGLYTDGHLQSLAGAMGNVSSVWRAGRPARWAWEFWGVIQAESDTALLTPTYPTLIPPTWINTTNTYDSVAMRCSQMTFNLQNTVVPREDPNSAGIRSAVIVHRDPIFELDPEAVLVATKNWQQYFWDSTLAAATFTIGTDSNNIVTIAAAKAQVTAYPMANRNGIMVRNLRLSARRNASTYDSEHSIVFS